MRRIALAASCGMLWLGCAEPPGETQEIIDNLVEAGFPANDIMVVNGVVYVGRDAEVSLASSREMIRAANTSKEQYRTTNTISTSLAKICINGSTFTGVFSAPRTPARSSTGRPTRSARRWRRSASTARRSPGCSAPRSTWRSRTTTSSR
jgi:hypothetical protein